MHERQRRRIHEARRIGLRNRMRDEWRVPEAVADTLLAEWLVEAASRGLDTGDPACWEAGASWLRARVPD